MSIRRDAKDWLLQHGIDASGPLYTSKLYSPASSWTGAEAWWIQIPLARIQGDQTIHIVCESESTDAPFRHLAVPASFLRRNLSRFGMIGERSINLFLSAEPHQLFTDLRGSDRIDFSPFATEVSA